MLVLIDGTHTSKEQITQAFNEGKARLVHGNKTAGCGSSTGLSIDGKDIDTRGKCESVWEEVWTRKPDTLDECIRAAQ